MMMISLCLFIYLHNWFAAYIAGQLCIYLVNGHGFV